MTAASSWLMLKISAAQAEAPELAEHWSELDKLYSRRLWHELTVKLLAFVKHESFASGGLTELYNNLIVDIADRIKPLSLVTLVQAAAIENPDPEATIAFLTPVKEKVKHAPLALASLSTTIAELQMGLGELDTTKTLMAECELILNGVNGVTSTHADYYRVAAQLKQLLSDHAGYYQDALRFLGCVEKDELSLEERAGRAFDLGLAALLGKDIYNVGELLAHDIIEALRETDKQWLVELLYAFNSGSVKQFHDLKPQWSAGSADLASNETLLVEKFRLLAVMEVVFQRGTAERRVTFADVASAAGVGVSEVELLVMKALSKKLVKGTINQLEQYIDFTWVQPRVLAPAQLLSMKNRLETWLLQVEKATKMVDLNAPALDAEAAMDTS